MKRKEHYRRSQRRGAIAVLAAIVLILFVGMLAFTIDYGYVLQERYDLQRAADAAVLAAVQDLMPQDPTLAQDPDAAKATCLQFVRSNLAENGFDIDDADIETGRFEPSTVYTNFTIVQNGLHDTIRVTLRRDGSTNPFVSMFFGQALGVDQAEISVTSTAVLQKARLLIPGTGVLPFAIPMGEWEYVSEGEEWNIYGDGRIVDGNGDLIPGNWGTVDIGRSGNSTNDLSDQIINGLRQSDLDALYADDRIDAPTHIDTTEIVLLNSDTGLSSGLKHALEAVEGQTRVAPLYDWISTGSGDNLEFRIVGWGIVTVEGSNFHGSNNSSVTVSKSVIFDGILAPQDRLDADVVFEGNYTSPVLVQ